MFLLITVLVLGRFIAVWLTVTLTNALSSVGFKCVGLPWSTDCSQKMETDRADKDRPRIQVVDYLYKSPNLPHTNLLDATPIVISTA